MKNLNASSWGSSRAVMLLLVALLVVVPAGCGRKTMPKPFTPDAISPIGDMEIAVRSQGVEISWAIPEQIKTQPKGSGLKFTIIKTEVKWENRSCAECPAPGQQEILSVDPAFPDPARIMGGKMVFIDTAVAPQHAYKYQVTLVGSKGQKLSASNPVMAKVVPTPLPVKALNVVTQHQGILLQWKAQTRDDQGRPLAAEAQYIIERHSPDTEWTRITPVPIKGISYLDQSLASDRSYDYRVTPIVEFEGTRVYGEPTTFYQAKSPGELAPPPPKTVWVVPTKGSLEVQWNASEGKIAGYHVYRREGKEIIRLTASPISKPPYIDNAVKRNTIYFYAVSAVGPQADSKEGLLSKWVEIRSLSFE